MALSDRDIALFARDSVAADSLSARDEAGRERRLAQAQRVARSFQAAAEASVRASGYRVTRRVREKISDELRAIEEDAAGRPQVSCRSYEREQDGTGEAH